MTNYCPVDQAIAVMGSAQQTDKPRAFDRRMVYQNVRVASRRIDQLFHSRRPLFAPYIETRKFALDGTAVNSRMGTFHFSDWLLALNGTVSINGTSIAALELYPDADMPPVHQLRLTGDCADWYSQVCACGTPLQVSVPGVWGFHSDYGEAWLAVDALAAAITDAAATTLTVADVDGADVFGITPRFSEGSLIRVDSEYMEVTAVAPSTNTLTVRRGVNGSTAATHLIGAAVSTWQVEAPVQRAVARQAGLMYARFGAYTTVETTEYGEVRYPADWLQEVMATMQAYAYS